MTAPGGRGHRGSWRFSWCGRARAGPRVQRSTCGGQGPRGHAQARCPGVRASPRVWAEPPRRSLPRLNVHALSASRAWGEGTPSCSPGIVPSSAPGGPARAQAGPWSPGPGVGIGTAPRPRRALGRACLPTLVAINSDISALPVCARMHAGKGRTSPLGGCRAGARGLLFHRTEALGAGGPGPG